MNLERMPSEPFKVDKDGYLSVEWQNWFSMNAQNMELFFSDTGHLVPSLTDEHVTVLSNAGTTNPTLFKARTLYNNGTSNFMGNVAGQYQNYTMNLLSTRSDILAMSHSGDRVQYFGDENKNLYANVNTRLSQVPQLLTTNTSTLNFKVDGSGNFFATINGVDKQVQLI